MRKKYREALLSHKKRLDRLDDMVGAYRYSKDGWKPSINGRLNIIEARFSDMDREQQEQEDIAALNVAQRRRYKKAREEYDHTTSLLIAKECCA